jgi:enolase
VATISNIHARQILDSRGNPTLEAEVSLSDGSFARAAVPSGASTGSKEVLELRDGEKAYGGKGVLKAVANVKNIFAPALKGMKADDQSAIDKKMIEMDGTEFKSKYGANAMLGISLAVARAQAISNKISLYRHLREKLHCPNPAGQYLLPAPLMNIINGGAHASNNLDIQEFMIVPHLKASFSENLRAGVEIFHTLKKVLSSKGHSTNVGDEGGFAPNLSTHEEAMEAIVQSIEKSGYKPGVEVSLSLDCASNEFYKNGRYEMQGKTFNSDEMISYYSNLCAKFPIYSIEDGLSEDDHKGWKELTRTLGKKVVLVGDDLFVTNPSILKKGIADSMANALLVKVNQIGTLTETFQAMAMAYEAGYKAIISHRSGETGDAFIADLAVATASGHIKTGSASRSDRLEKYNQLLRIEEELGASAKYHLIK